MAFNLGISSGTDALSNAVSSIGTSAAAGAPAPTTTSPLSSFDASSYGLGGGKTAALDKFAGIIQSGGTLKPGQEAKLSNISAKAGLDFASTLGYTPTSEKYTYTAPVTTPAQVLRGDDIREAGPSSGGGGTTDYAQAAALTSFDPTAYDLGTNKTARLDKFADIIESGGTLTPTQEAKLANLSERAGLDLAAELGYNPVSQRYDYVAPTVADTSASTMVDNPWTASAGDLYQNLSPRQEDKLGKLSGLYAASLTGGDPLREGQLDKLDKFLGLADLGTRESYFSKPTYTDTTPEDFTTRTGGNLTYEDLANLYTSGNPILAYAASQKYGVTPEDFQAALGGYSKTYFTPSSTGQDVSNLLAAGQADYQNLQLAAAYYKDPDNPIFEDPSVRSRAEAALYTYQNPVTQPLSSMTTNRAGEEIAGSGQYGYYNNAPILNTAIFDQLLGDRNKIGTDALSSDLLNQLGWNFKSGEGLNFIQQGVRVVGLNEKFYTPQTLAAMDANAKLIDPETGVEYSEYQNERNALNAAAEKIGIDPTQYESAADLYNAVETATQDLYQVVGGYKNQWGEEASALGDKGNHANVIYRDVNGQLIPIAADLFKYERPEDPIIGGVVGDILANTPFLPEIVGFATGNAAIYAGLKGAQTASRPGADFGDVAVATALAYYTPEATKAISETIGNFLPTDFVTNNPMLSDYITKAGTNITLNLATSALRGQDIDIESLITNTLTGSAIQVGAGEALKLTDFPPDMQKAIAQIVARVAMGGDVQNAITNAVARIGVNAIRNTGSQTQSGTTTRTAS